MSSKHSQERSFEFRSSFPIFFPTSVMYLKIAQFVTLRWILIADYLEEINTALATRGEDFYFETLENVQNELEQEREKYDDLAKKYATGTAGIAGTGIAGKLVPEFHSETAEHIDILTQNDLATIGIIAAFGLSTVPAYKAKQHKDKRDQIDQLIEDLEEGNYDQADTEFAYEIADAL